MVDMYEMLSSRVYVVDRGLNLWYFVILAVLSTGAYFIAPLLASAMALISIMLYYVVQSRRKIVVEIKHDTINYKAAGRALFIRRGDVLAIHYANLKQKDAGPIRIVARNGRTDLIDASKVQLQGSRFRVGGRGVEFLSYLEKFAGLEATPEKQK